MNADKLHVAASALDNLQEKSGSMHTFDNVDCAHALDPLPVLKLMLLGALPPDTVRGIVTCNSQIGCQLYTFYVHSGRLR